MNEQLYRCPKAVDGRCEVETCYHYDPHILDKTCIYNIEGKHCPNCKPYYEDFLSADEVYIR